MLAKRFAGIMPRLMCQEAIQTTQMPSVAGLLQRGRGLCASRYCTLRTHALEYTRSSSADTFRHQQTNSGTAPRTLPSLTASTLAGAPNLDELEQQLSALEKTCSPLPPTDLDSAALDRHIADQLARYRHKMSQFMIAAHHRSRKPIETAHVPRLSLFSAE